MMNGDRWIGYRLGSFELRQLLGQGLASRVYVAYNAELEVYGAVKIIFSGSPPDAGFIAQLRQEVEAFRRLKHPRVIALREIGPVEDAWYALTEYVDGVSLSELLDDASLFEVLYDITPTILQDLAQALDYAHGQGVVHGSIKPSNVLIDRKGRANLADFGQSSLRWSEQAVAARESVLYQPPERALSPQKIDTAGDLYALGVILYELLAGRPPFMDPSPGAVALQHVHSPPPAPRTLNPKLPAAAEQVLLRALQKPVEARYPTAGKLSEALRRAMAETRGPGSVQAAEGEPAKQKGGRAEQESKSARARLANIVDQRKGSRPQAGSSGVEQPGGPHTGNRIATEDDERLRSTLGRLAVGGCLFAALLVVGAGLLAGALGFWRPPLAPASAQSSAATQSDELKTAAPNLSQALRNETGPSLLPTGPAAPNVEVIYDGSRATVINTSDRSLSLEGVTFHRLDRDDEFTATFSANLWDLVAARPVSALPSGDCYQLRRSDAEARTPAGCRRIQGWLATRNRDWYFWISESGQELFAVVFNGRVVHICPISDRRCVFYLPQG